MGQILETERLRLRELNHNDAGFIVKLLNSPGWLQYIGDRKVRTEAQAKTYLDNGPIKSYSDNGFGLYMVETKHSNTSIGMCGILKRDTLDFPDIGFAFLPAYSGFGYAREIASATLDYARDTLHLPKLLAITKPDNQRSIDLLKHIGLIYITTLQSPDKEELLLFSIDFNAASQPIIPPGSSD